MDRLRLKRLVFNRQGNVGNFSLFTSAGFPSAVAFSSSPVALFLVLLLVHVMVLAPASSLAEFSAGFAPGISSGEQQITELYITLDKSRMNYEREILGRIERAKRYPSSARRQGLEGAPVVDFTLSRDGQITALRLEQPSSVEMLDQEALQIIARAAPFPEAPESFPGDGLRFQVPIAFRLKK